MSCEKSMRFTVTNLAGRDYISEEFTRALLKTHGVQIGEKYAEVFEIPRLIF